ncbi:hypothetical protein AB1K84_02990 [Mesobacillus foraminis]|uniref:hypothetical protein n=1 Tax=Mesobacillus foraminis TaxID=279826 RepID=UPI0039A2AE7D
MLGAENYQPKPYSESSEMMKDHQSNLETIIGKRMKELWVAWDTNIHEWFNDAPVIIVFEEGQIELCAFKSVQFIIIFNEMTLSKPNDWYGTGLQLSWKKNGLK